eukprot:gene28907-22229_t
MGAFFSGLAPVCPPEDIAARSGRCGGRPGRAQRERGAAAANADPARAECGECPADGPSPQKAI